ncbi:MAG: methyltransferase domain-containing protein [Bryobacteraceae bacterium]
MHASRVTLAVALASLPAGLWAQQISTSPIKRLAPFVASPQNVVEKMLEAADVKPNENVYDLGSGDGRVLITAAQRFGAKAVGIEISAKEVKSSTERIKQLKLDDRIQVVEGDLLTADLSKADVVTIYLLTTSNEQIRPKLEKSLHAGARVVSHDYQIPGWTPKKVEKVEAHKRTHQLYVYEMPPQKQQQ